ncbi:hypothetical protein MAR_004198 [Mya arenaria]|uniref:Uncharacterized protein n=1 Tax=Mya arenaria TaxID=6604 RepID=A0ABY7F029_MYAAR|nr:hypothetical protein MAR_004198 [Mya arenaria]
MFHSGRDVLLQNSDVNEKMFCSRTAKLCSSVLLQVMYVLLQIMVSCWKKGVSSSGTYGCLALELGWFLQIMDVLLQIMVSCWKTGVSSSRTPVCLNLEQDRCQEVRL